jgi:hypothetical protein
MTTTETPAYRPPSADAFPLTCEQCKHAPGTHYLVYDMTGHGRYTAFICDGCAHEPSMHVLPSTVTAMWLFALTPDDPWECEAGR